MHNRVTWKKGMRLSPDVFNAMEKANEDSIRMASLPGAANRYGLFTTNRPFELSVNINGNVLEVTTLNCHGITKSGCVIDIEFDSNFANTFDTSVPIPLGAEGEALYLVVKIHEGEWREIDDTYSELSYGFELQGENSIIADNCLPIGLLVNQYGWRLDDTGFVPPCLYVSAHPKYIEQLERAKTFAREMSSNCLISQNCVAKALLASVWNASSTVWSRLDKEYDTLTPGQLFSSVQRLVSSFIVGCFEETYVSLENQDSFVVYVQKVYDARNIYRDIETGLSLCAEISAKMSEVFTMTETQKPAEEKPVRKPKPQPQPQPEIFKPGRKRWEGIEI